MQPFPIPNEPPILQPCRVLRGRKELSTRDTVNARFVEQWLTDAPALQYDRRDPNAQMYFNDTNPIASRNYKEDLRQWYSYKVPGPQTPEINQSVQLNQELSQAYEELQSIDTQIQTFTVGTGQLIELRRSIQKLEFEKNRLSADEPTRLLLERQIQELREKNNSFLNSSNTLSQLKQNRLTVQNKIGNLQAQLYTHQLNTLGQNPYFNKYDIATDPRNVIRELRSVVTEDTVDRGVRESRALLKREFENRWVDQSVLEKKGYTTMEAYDKMRPQLNDMSMSYRQYKGPQPKSI